MGIVFILSTDDRPWSEFLPPIIMSNGSTVWGTPQILFKTSLHLWRIGEQYEANKHGTSISWENIWKIKWEVESVGSPLPCSSSAADDDKPRNVWRLVGKHKKIPPALHYCSGLKGYLSGTIPQRIISSLPWIIKICFVSRFAKIQQNEIYYRCHFRLVLLWIILCKFKSNAFWIFSLVLVAIMVVSGVSAAEDENCNKFCPYNYAPICAGPENDSVKPATFGNDCALEVYNCENKASSECNIREIMWDGIVSMIIFFF